MPGLRERLKIYDGGVIEMDVQYSVCGACGIGAKVPCELVIQDHLPPVKGTICSMCGFETIGVEDYREWALMINESGLAPCQG